MIKDITGNRYGRLVVLSYVGQNKYRKSVWLCMCDCGNTIEVNKNALHSGNTTSCGCYNKEVVSLESTDAGINRVLHTYKDGASKRNLEFSLDRNTFISLIFGDCYYCGSSPKNYHKHQYHEGGMFYNGIDRLDSSKGYIKNNVVSCCSDCNYAKRKMNVASFVGWIKRISKGDFFLSRKFGGTYASRTGEK